MIDSENMRPTQSLNKWSPTKNKKYKNNFSFVSKFPLSQESGVSNSFKKSKNHKNQKNNKNQKRQKNNKNKKSSKRNIAFSHVLQNMSLSATFHYSPHLVINAFVKSSCLFKSIPVKILIDSGSNGNYISAKTVFKNRLGKIKKPSGDIYPLKTIDGSAINFNRGQVDSHTELLLLTISDHSEHLSMDIIPLPHYDIILGIPWLKTHNPNIDWLSERLQFNRCNCNSKSPPPIKKGTLRQQIFEEAGMMTSNDYSVWKIPSESLTPLSIQICSPEGFTESLESSEKVGLLWHTWHKVKKKVKPALSSLMNSIKKGPSNKKPQKGAEETANTEPITVLPKDYQEFKPMFDLEKYMGLPEYQPWDHKIPLQPNTTPPFRSLFALTLKELDALKKYIVEKTRLGHIRPSTSSAGAPILFAKKKDGSLRLCVDYRGLNNITIKNKYPLPLIQELLQRLSEAKYFTKLDLKDGYNHIRMAKGEEWKTAFRTRYGHFEYLVMPMGLTNAPASFQELINNTLREFLDTSVIVYLDDILIYSKSYSQHIKDVRAVLRRLREKKFFCNLKKCSFHKQEIEYVGYIISPSGASMDPRKVKAVKEWPSPKNIHDLMSFLGFANYYRRFIERYSGYVVPLTKLLKKDAKYEWTSEQQEAFETLKRKFTTAPVLVHFDPSKAIFLETDASDFALGACLSQPDSSGRLRPVAFYSRKFNSAELNYEIHDKELLAIVASFKEFRVYLEGSQHTITVYSDHKNLTYFTTSKDLNRRQVRWSELLSSYNFTIVHRPGTLNKRADALSRRPDYVPTGHTQEIPPLLKTNQLQIALTQRPSQTLEEKIKTAQAQDSQCKAIIKDLQDPDIHDPTTFSLDPSGLILFSDKVYIPKEKSLRLELFHEHHDSLTAGHFGIEKTYEAISRNYYFPEMRQEITKFIKTCPTCARAKAQRHKPFGKLQPLQVPENPWESITMDFIVKLPPSQDPITKFTYDSILVVVDRLTKMGYFIPYRETFKAPDFAQLMFQHIFSQHGIPLECISDRGSVFISNFIQTLYKLLDTKQKLSTAYHPQTDGQTERLNQTLEQYLRCYCNYMQNNWYELLHTAQFAYNNSIQSTIKVTPLFANFGRHPRMHITNSDSIQSASESAEIFAVNLNTLHKQLKEDIIYSQYWSSRYYNSRREAAPDLQVGQKVYLSAKNYNTRRLSEKLENKYLGPFTIAEKYSPLLYKLELPPTMKIHPVFHVSLLQPRSQEISIRSSSPPPPPIIINEEGDEEFEVEAILDSRKRGKGVQYLVHWKGYPDHERTWEPLRNLIPDTDNLLRDFHLQHPQKPFDGQQYIQQ